MRHTRENIIHRTLQYYISLKNLLKHKHLNKTLISASDASYSDIWKILYYNYILLLLGEMTFFFEHTISVSLSLLEWPPIIETRQTRKKMDSHAINHQSCEPGQLSHHSIHLWLFYSFSASSPSHRFLPQSISIPIHFLLFPFSSFRFFHPSLSAVIFLFSIWCSRLPLKCILTVTKNRHKSFWLLILTFHPICTVYLRQPINKHCLLDHGFIIFPSICTEQFYFECATKCWNAPAYHLTC